MGTPLARPSHPTRLRGAESGTALKKMRPALPQATPAGSQTARGLVGLAHSAVELAGAAGERAPHPRASGSPVVFIGATEHQTRSAIEPVVESHPHAPN
jgi:hypothetical protein